MNKSVRIPKNKSRGDVINENSNDSYRNYIIDVYYDNGAVCTEGNSSTYGKIIF